jgi:16S rRNA (guanine527-N7)-methyltransferase
VIRDEASAREYVGTLCDSVAMERLERFAALLAAENARQNLASRGTMGFLWQRHIADSAQLLELAGNAALSPWLDLGTGAGFPGLVLAAMRPNLAVFLVESRRMRIEWLRRVVADLNLENCRIEGRRLELVDAFPAGAISARAFAPLRKLLHLSRRFSTNDTLWLLPKGRSAEQELSQLPRKWRDMFHVEQSLTDPDARILVGKEANRT